ncbi:hypothetical protein [Thiocapsa rosea]|nr:hypothetical protein [Thiocapsa rosea]
MVGRRYVDKLVKVWRLGGEETWVLIHAGVQGEPDPDERPAGCTDRPR